MSIQQADSMSNALVTILIFLVCALISAALVGRMGRGCRFHHDAIHSTRCAVARGTVRAEVESGGNDAGGCSISIDVESLSGQRFTGRLRFEDCGEHGGAALRPGVIVLVAFDPAAPEHLSLADDMLAVRAAFDQMLVRKGLITTDQLHLIRHGTRSNGVITAMHVTGGINEDYREVELDLMVKKADGGQFPAHETAWVPASSLDNVSPGSVIETYYEPGDQSAVAVHVPPS